MEDRRAKYTNNPIKNKDLKVDVNFDITSLDVMCSYIVSNNRNITRGNVINLRNLILLIDMNNYSNDTERLKRFDFILKGIDARLNYNLTNTDMIVSHIAGGIGCTTDIKYNQLNNDELNWVNQTVSETLKYSIIYNDVDRGLALLTKFKSTDYAYRGPVVKEIEQWISDIQVKFRNAKADDVSNMTFSLSGDNFINTMRETYRLLSSPSNRLKFGTQGLNALTGGGVEAARVYTLLGLPSEGKSSTLLDIAIQIKRYNKKYICKDPTKRPCVVLLIMENDIKESVQRLFSMCVGQDMLNYSEDEFIDVLKTSGNMKLSNDDPIDIIIKFKPNMSVDTSYIYDLTEDLEDEGYEVIALVQDYIKSIRSVNGNYGGELRLQLGAVINEFKVFAMLKNIPVITASQLNRTAASNIDEAKKTNKADLVRLLGRSNVGESHLILENSDWVGLIAPEYDRDGNKYLGVQRVKSRYYIPGDFAYAYLPYMKGTIKFIEDYYSAVPVHKLSMREPVELNNGIPNNAQGIVNNIKDFTEVNNIKLVKDGTPNIFQNASAVVNHQVQYLKTMACISKVNDTLSQPMARIIQNK